MQVFAVIDRNCFTYHINRYMEHSSIPHVQEGMIVVHSLLIPYSINESTSILIKKKRYKLSFKDSKVKLSFTLTLETKGIFD